MIHADVSLCAGCGGAGQPVCLVGDGGDAVSIKYMDRVWQRKTLKGGKLLLMLALADHANDAGECWPSQPHLAQKARLTERQIRRVIAALICDELLAVVEQGVGRGKKTVYQLFPADIKADISDIKADILSKRKADILSESTIKADISDNKSGHLQQVKADISEPIYSHVRSESPIQPPIEPNNNNRPVRDAIHQSWFDTYDAEMPTEIEALIIKDLSNCPVEAVIHAITVTASAKERTYRYLKKCALNYIPPAPASQSNGYSVHLPAAAPSAPLPKAAPPAPSMPGDDLWSIVLAELRRDLPMGFVPTLEGSRLLEAGMVQREDGLSIALYQVLIAPEQAVKGLTYFQRQCAASIRRSLSSVLHEPVLIEILSDEKEMV